MVNNRMTEGVGKKIVDALKKQFKDHPGQISAY